LEGEKAQVSCSLEVVGSQTGIPKGLEKNQKFQWREGVNNFGIWRIWRGGRTFWFPEGKGGGGVKCSCRPW